LRLQAGLWVDMMQKEATDGQTRLEVSKNPLKITTNGTSGRTMGRNKSQGVYQTNIAETCKFKCHQTQYFANFSFNDDFYR
jgi:hypothetical protein